MTYWRVSGVVLAALAALGILLVAVDKARMLDGVMAFDVAHNLLHVALAGPALALGFGTPRLRQARLAARGLGAALLLLGLLGFASATLFGLGDLVGLRFEVGENLVHLALGAWGLYAGSRG